MADQRDVHLSYLDRVIRDIPELGLRSALVYEERCPPVLFVINTAGEKRSAEIVCDQLVYKGQRWGWWFMWEEAECEGAVWEGSGRHTIGPVEDPLGVVRLISRVMCGGVALT